MKGVACWLACICWTQTLHRTQQNTAEHRTYLAFKGNGSSFIWKSCLHCDLIFKQKIIILLFFKFIFVPFEQIWWHFLSSQLTQLCTPLTACEESWIKIIRFDKQIRLKSVVSISEETQKRISITISRSLELPELQLRIDWRLTLSFNAIGIRVTERL